MLGAEPLGLGSPITQATMEARAGAEPSHQGAEAQTGPGADDVLGPILSPSMPWLLAGAGAGAATPPSAYLHRRSSALLSARHAAVMGSKPDSACSSASKVIDDILDSAVSILHFEELRAGRQDEVKEQDLLESGAAAELGAQQKGGRPKPDAAFAHKQSSSGSSAVSSSLDAIRLSHHLVHPFSAPGVLMHGPTLAAYSELAERVSLGQAGHAPKKSYGRRDKGVPAHNAWRASDFDDVEVENNAVATGVEMDQDLDDDDDDTEYMDVGGTDDLDNSDTDEGSRARSGEGAGSHGSGSRAVMPYFEGSSAGSVRITQGQGQKHRQKSDQNDVVDNGVRLLGRKYESQHVVGEGAYGMVIKCRVRGNPGQIVAIKEFKIEVGGGGGVLTCRWRGAGAGVGAVQGESREGRKDMTRTSANPRPSPNPDRFFTVAPPFQLYTCVRCVQCVY